MKKIIIIILACNLGLAVTEYDGDEVYDPIVTRPVPRGTKRCLTIGYDVFDTIIGYDSQAISCIQDGKWKIALPKERK